ncbi:hypothetical protein GN244_ATG16551 [Phytophthora infestans]|uniref:Uncharacterized protein n=1 Tax=Phytophthora infestans TaxID=4787 RepID=A0A833SAG6_PHYIN|nr:hypothetical protein GN244_ATG16551 [Phytophthora infestans]KAF4136438.1 hypothetical protein GN958_ATG14368 [Phytophthora infestans]
MNGIAWVIPFPARWYDQERLHNGAQAEVNRLEAELDLLQRDPKKTHHLPLRLRYTIRMLRSTSRTAIVPTWNTTSGDRSSPWWTPMTNSGRWGSSFRDSLRVQLRPASAAAVALRDQVVNQDHELDRMRDDR